MIAKESGNTAPPKPCSARNAISDHTFHAKVALQARQRGHDHRLLQGERETRKSEDPQRDVVVLTLRLPHSGTLAGGPPMPIQFPCAPSSVSVQPLAPSPVGTSRHSGATPGSR